MNKKKDVYVSKLNAVEDLLCKKSDLKKDTTVLGRIISVSRDYTANSVCAINVVGGQEHGSFQKLFFRNGVSQESRTILEKRKALAGTVWSLDIENPRATGVEPQQRHVILIVIRSQPCLRL